MHGVNPLCIAAQSSRFTSSHQVVGRRTESDRTADGIRSGGGRNLIGRRTVSSRGCSCLSCTNQADRHVRSVGALITRLVHLLLGWCTWDKCTPWKAHPLNRFNPWLNTTHSQICADLWNPWEKRYSHRTHGTHRNFWQRRASHRWAQMFTD